LETLSKLGLITNHAYTVINSAVLKKSNGAEIKLLKMKNMWGTNEWVGDWSDSSTKWTQEFKKEVGKAAFMMSQIRGVHEMTKASAE
jgi:calpain-15